MKSTAPSAARERDGGLGRSTHHPARGEAKMAETSLPRRASFVHAHLAAPARRQKLVELPGEA
jgi:hypothetical protein